MSGGCESAGSSPAPLLFVFLDSPLSRRMTGGGFHSSAIKNGQFDKLTDHTGERSLSLPKGPFPNSIFIPSLTHPALKAVFCFRGKCFCFLLVLPSVASAYFRVIPCSSVANASASAYSSFRGKCFCLVFLPWLILRVFMQSTFNACLNDA